MRADPPAESCDAYQDAISAFVDGEESPIEELLVERHLSHCAECAAFRAAAESGRRRGPVREVAPEPDIAHRISSMAALADRAASWRTARVLLIVVALEVLALSAIDLFAAQGDPASVHSARHLSAFTIAYGVLLLVVAARPARARSALPVAAVLAGALAITAIIDLATGRIPLIGEALHIPELLSVLLIWLLAVPGPRRRARGSDSTERAAAPPLRLVDRDPV